MYMREEALVKANTCLCERILADSVWLYVDFILKGKAVGVGKILEGEKQEHLLWETGEHLRNGGGESIGSCRGEGRRSLFVSRTYITMLIYYIDIINVGVWQKSAEMISDISLKASRRPGRDATLETNCFDRLPI